MAGTSFAVPEQSFRQHLQTNLTQASHTQREAEKHIAWVKTVPLDLDVDAYG
jgi:hypothetical protein